MNTPNKLTLLRIAMVPLFFVFFLFSFPQHYLAAAIVFAAASVTDLIDGSLARRNNQVTDFGKFLDPVADKMLTSAAFVGFTFAHIGRGIEVITVIVLTREFLVTSVRLVAAANGRVVAANSWGKAKTVSQMTAILITLAWLCAADIGSIPANVKIAVDDVCSGLLWVSAVLTLFSGAVYLKDNWALIDHRK